jgi:hypothetical protein
MRKGVALIAWIKNDLNQTCDFEEALIFWLLFDQAKSNKIIHKYRADKTDNQIV